MNALIDLNRDCDGMTSKGNGQPSPLEQLLVFPCTEVSCGSHPCSEWNRHLDVASTFSVMIRVYTLYEKNLRFHEIRKRRFLFPLVFVINCTFGKSRLVISQSNNWSLLAFLVWLFSSGSRWQPYVFKILGLMTWRRGERKHKTVICGNYGHCRHRCQRDRRDHRENRPRR